MTASSESSKKTLKRSIRVIALAVFVGIGIYGFFLVNRGEPPQPQPNIPQPAAAPDVGEVPDIPFVNIAKEWGVEFVHRNGATGEKLLPESMGGGAAFFDFDKDGDPDLLLVSGQSWPWDDDTNDPRSSSLSLFRNDNDRFVDVTEEAGLAIHYYGQGVAVGDYDSDGDDDLFLTAVGNNLMFRNDGGRFVDVTEETGLMGNESDWTSSAGFFDYDRDGDLDLFVCNYIQWSREIDKSAGYTLSGIGRAYAPPFNFAGTQCYLYRNDGARFTDVSAQAGVQVLNDSTDDPVGKALAVTFLDFDRDGWVDVFVANDMVKNFLFRNKGDGTFEELGEWYRFAYDSNGGATSAMGIDSAYFRNNNDLAIAIGNFSNEMTSLYVSQDGDGVFTDEAITAGIGGPTRTALSFGLLFDDMDLDSRVDFLQTNGHLEEDINLVQQSQQYRQEAQLFWNAGLESRHDFIELASGQVGDLATPIVGRGLASADIDQDGDLDLVLTQVAGPPLLLRNDQETGHHWLRCKLDGPPGNPHGYGAMVELEAGGVVQRRVITPSRSYLSQIEPIATFGLGEVDRVDRVSVQWPDGTEQVIKSPEVDRVITVKQAVEDFAGLMNIAKAQLEVGKYSEAVEALKTALSKRPKSVSAHRNLVRAYLFGGRPGDAAQALEELDAIELGDSPASTYLSGLLAMRESRFADAIADFQATLQTDRDSATVHFQLATALAGAGRHDEAEKEFRQAAHLDPLHGGAQFQLASYARKRGDREEFNKYQRDYQRIKNIKGATTTDTVALEACVYTQAEAAPQSETPSRSKTPPTPHFELRKLTSVRPEDDIRFANIAVNTLESSGRYGLIGITLDGRLLAMQLNDAADRYEVVAQSTKLADRFHSNTALLIGNAIVDPLDEEGNPQGDHNEIAVVTPDKTLLFRYRPKIGFEDLTPGSGLRDAGGSTARWIDLDHDGDLDLVVAGKEATRVWRNSGVGGFSLSTENFHLEDVGGASDIGFADFDGANLGIDLVMVGSKGALIAFNQFGGRFAIDEADTADWLVADRVLVDDFDNSGLPDILVATPKAMEMRFDKVDSLPNQIDLSLDSIADMGTIDYNNDGWLDVWVAGERAAKSGVWLLPSTTQEVTEPLFLTSVANAVRLVDLDADADGDTDLLAVDSDGSLWLLVNTTADIGKQLKLSLKSFVGHPSSIGTRAQVRRNELVVSRWTQRQTPIEIGVGPHDEVDSIQTLWQNGVANNEISIAVSKQPLEIFIIEFVRTSSCPFLYAWQNGEYRFVTDVLGAAPLNVAVARDVPLPTDADEVVVLGPASHFASNKTSPRMRITCELREVVYVDEVHLLAVEHPPNAAVFSMDRSSQQATTGAKAIAGHAPTRIRDAQSSDGVDRLDALAQCDGEFAPPGPALEPPLVGYTAPLAIEFDFGDLNETEPMLLALTGWFRFGSSSSNIAASQRESLQVVWPRLEVRDAAGEWRVVSEDIGFPTGITKTIVCDLTGKLHPGDNRFRLTTSFEVRWDNFALYKKVAASELQVEELTPIQANLDWHGFAELRTTSNAMPQIPNLDVMRSVPPWSTAVPGWCTRYGDVRELVNHADPKVAILNAGDGLTLAFEAPQPASEERGQTLLLYLRGWIKEGDPNAIDGDRVAPFPGSDIMQLPGEQDWQLRYNTRWVPANRFPLTN